MVTTTTNDYGNIDVITANGNEGAEYISSLFEEAKKIYKSAENGGSTNLASEEELSRIKNEFDSCSNYKGAIYCQKALSIVQEKRGDNAIELDEKLEHYEAAHDTINEAIIAAKKHSWLQSSLLKRQAIVKSKLGDTLHKMSDHINANILEKSAFKIFTEMLKENSRYAEGHLELAFWSLNKLRNSLKCIEIGLTKAEALFLSPKYTKNLPDEIELQKHSNSINEMSDTIRLLSLCFTQPQQ